MEEFDDIDQRLKKSAPLLRAVDAAPVSPPPEAVAKLNAALSACFEKIIVLTKSQMQCFIFQMLRSGMQDGIAIVDHLKKNRATLSMPGEGLIYGVLNQAETSGLLQSEWRASGGEMAKVYRLTDKGTKQLQRDQSMADQLQASLLQRGDVF